MSYQNYSIPLPPIPRACTTYTLVRHLWKMYEFAHFVVHALPDHVNRPLDLNIGGFNMHNNKEELLKDLIKTRSIDELEPDILVPTPLEMFKEEIENSAERKRQLMRLEKEHLVDMVFNLESRNEMLTNNLIEVEKMYNKLKEEK